MADDDEPATDKDLKPRPDPTVLTAMAVKDATDQMRRDMKALDDRVKSDALARSALADSRIDSLQSLIEARLKAIEQAAVVFEATLARVPSVTDVAVSHLRELNDSKFTAIYDQLDQRDKRYSLVSSDAKAAVADALAAQQKSVADAFDAQQKSVDKQDIATQKAIDQQSVLLTSTASGQSTQINDLKERMTRAETANANAISAQSTKTTSVGQLISWGLLGVAALALILPFILSHAGTATGAK
jgi:hypothetical protein